MKLLYKAFIVIVLLSCHLMSAIADNTHLSPTSTITDTYRHNNNQYHSYEEINAILDKNYFQGYVMAQQNIDFAKYTFNESMNLMKYTVQKSFKLAHNALNNSTITHNEQLLKPTLDFSSNIVKRLNFDYIINMSYSLDFRRKVLAIKKEKGLSIKETAKHFCIGSATVSRWIKQINPKPAASRSRKIDKSA